MVKLHRDEACELGKVFRDRKELQGTFVLTSLHLCGTEFVGGPDEGMVNPGLGCRPMEVRWHIRLGLRGTEG